jgi:hypothetical protein
MSRLFIILVLGCAGTANAAGIPARNEVPKVGSESIKGETQEIKHKPSCVTEDKLHPVTGEVIGRKVRCGI